MSLTVDEKAGAMLRGSLEPGEALVWADRPRVGAFISPPRPVVVAALLWAILESFYAAGAFGGVAVPVFLGGALLKLVAVQAAPLALLLGWPAVRWLAWRNTAYGLSDRRLLLRQGAFGQATALGLDQVDGVELAVQGRAFGVGTVTLLRGAPAKPIRLEAVNDAFHVSTLARQLGRVAAPEEGKTQA